MVGDVGFEPDFALRAPPGRPATFPHLFALVGEEGIEPSASRSQTERSAGELLPEKVRDALLRWPETTCRVSSMTLSAVADTLRSTQPGCPKDLCTAAPIPEAV